MYMLRSVWVFSYDVQHSENEKKKLSLGLLGHYAAKILFFTLTKR